MSLEIDGMLIALHLKISFVLHKPYEFVSADEEGYNTMMTSMENLNHVSQVSSTPCNKVTIIIRLFIFL